MSATEQTFWNKKIATWYNTADWAGKPSIFVQDAKGYFPPSGKVLELGCGAGQDGLWLAVQGYEVVQTDFIDGMFPAIRDKAAKLGVQTALRQLDIRNLSDLGDDSFDIVYSHLSLHYFDHKTTKEIFAELHKILRPGGVLAALFNSISDPEYLEAREKIEPHYVQVGDIKKRFLDEAEAREFAAGFQILLADNNGETYKDRAIGVKNLIRLIAKK
jgi:SAM-dependent methyltransferase